MYLFWQEVYLYCLCCLDFSDILAVAIFVHLFLCRSVIIQLNGTSPHQNLYQPLFWFISSYLSKCSANYISFNTGGVSWSVFYEGEMSTSSIHTPIYIWYNASFIALKKTTIILCMLLQSCLRMLPSFSYADEIVPDHCAFWCAQFVLFYQSNSFAEVFSGQMYWLSKSHHLYQRATQFLIYFVEPPSWC